MPAPKFLTESDIQWACSHTDSAVAAAEFLGVNYSTFKKYAKQYWYDRSQGITWLEYQKNQGGGNVAKTNAQGELIAGDEYEKLEKFFSSKKRYSESNIIKWLVREAWKEERCEMCDHRDLHPTKYSTPLLLSFKDGDDTNITFDNIRFLCYNCYYHTHDEFPLQKRFFGKTR